jgi:hypothetical protein
MSCCCLYFRIDERVTNDLKKVLNEDSKLKKEDDSAEVSLTIS